MEYLGCKGCSNNAVVELCGKVANVCMGNVNNPLKCVLRKRVVDPDWVEFFNATCERFREVNNAR